MHVKATVNSHCFVVFFLCFLLFVCVVLSIKASKPQHYRPACNSLKYSQGLTLHSCFDGGLVTKIVVWYFVLYLLLCSVCLIGLLVNCFFTFERSCQDYLENLINASLVCLDFFCENDLFSLDELKPGKLKGKQLQHSPAICATFC